MYLNVGPVVILIEQSGAENPLKHSHVPFTHVPFPLHSPGHEIANNSAGGLSVPLPDASLDQYVTFEMKSSLHISAKLWIAEFTNAKSSAI